MAGNTAILAVKIIGDGKSASGALDSVSASAGSMERGMDRAAATSGIALAAIGTAAFAAAQVAANAEQQVGAVDAVFKQYSSQMHGYADQAAETVGLSKAEYSQMASILGSQLKNMGLSLDEVGGKTNDFIVLGADLAAQFGGSTSDAVAALSSLLRGERDPIERYGVSIKQADVEAQKAAMGLTGLSGEAEKNADLQATLALLTKQTADAQGAFGREAETASNKQQIMNAKLEDATAQIGTAFLPFMGDAADKLAEFADWASQNSDLVIALTGAVAGLAAGIVVINGAMTAYSAVQAIQTAAQWANNAAWLASPVGLTVLAIVAAILLVITVTLLIIQHWDELVVMAEDVWNNISNFINQAYTAITAFFGVEPPAWFKGMFLGVGGIDFGTVFNGGGGGTASAARVAAEPMTMSARSFAPMALSMDAQPFMTSFSTPTMTSPTGALAARQAVAGGDTYNITVNGAVDPEGTARQIDGLMQTSRRATGRIAAGGTTWA